MIADGLKPGYVVLNGNISCRVWRVQEGNNRTRQVVRVAETTIGQGPPIVVVLASEKFDELSRKKMIKSDGSIVRETSVKPWEFDHKRYLGKLVYESQCIETVPSTVGDDASKIDARGRRYYTLVRLIEGDEQLFRRFIDGSDSWTTSHLIDVDTSFILPTPFRNLPRTKEELGGFSKVDLMAYFVDCNGKSTKEEILYGVAIMERKCWIPTSNTEYFSSHGTAHKYLKRVGKRKQSILYYLNESGLKRAKEVEAKLGNELSANAVHVVREELR